MTDKVQLIKEEIESYKESMKGLEPHSDFRRGQITAYNQIMQFIDSIPKEHNEDLDKLVISLEETIGTSPHSREVIKEYLQKAAEWGRNHIEDKSEMVSEDLEEYAKKLTKGAALDKHNLIWMCKKGAEWQKKKDQETIELAEDHAMLAGMNKMKEEMIKDAVDAVVYQGLYSKYVKERDDEALANVLKNYNSGDKVKIIIVKEE